MTHVLVGRMFRLVEKRPWLLADHESDGLPVVPNPQAEISAKHEFAFVIRSWQRWRMAIPRQPLFGL